MPARSAAVRVLGAAIAVTLATGVAAVATVDFEARPAMPAASPVAASSVDLAALVANPGAGDWRPAWPGKADLLAPGGAKDGGAAFQRLGLRSSYSRAWRSLDRRRTVAVFVFEFDADSGARAYADGLGGAARMLNQPKTFVVPGVPEGSGLVDGAPDAAGRRTQVVVLHDGNLAAVLVYFAPGLAPAPELTRLAQDQFAALLAA